MSNFDSHKEKYEMFSRDAEHDEISIPLRIEAYYASFHLVEAMAAKKGLHIEKHQKVRSFLEKSNKLIGNDTEKVWRAFHEIENQLRPGQIYGGQINGQKLARTQELFSIIESICLEALNDSAGI